MKKLRLLLGLFLLWPLLGSFTVKAAVVYPTDFGGFSDRTIYPITTNEYNFKYTWGFHATQDVKIELNAYIHSDIIDQKTGGAGYQAVISRSPIEVKAGNDYLWSRMIMADDITESIYTVECEFTLSYPGKRTVFWPTYFKFGTMLNGKTYYTLDPDTDTNVKGTYGLGTRFRNGRAYCYSHEIQTKGIQSVYTAPQANVVPLSQMLFKQKDYALQEIPFVPTKADLVLTNHIDLLPAFETSLYRGRRVVGFPLVFEEMSKNVYYPVSKDYMFTSPDGRTLRPKQGSAHDIRTKDILLPPVKTGESRTYDFVLILQGVGENGLWHLSINFSIIQTGNYFGSCGNSEFCVEEY